MAKNPAYSDYLKFAPTFRYGGREWGANDLAAFQKKLGKKNYARWARNHAVAAKVFDPTEQSVYGAVQPQLDAINYERSKAEAAARRRMGDLAGFTQAIMGMLGEISPAIRGAYGEGAETMRAGGTGYGDVLNQNMAANAAQGNSLLDTIGAPDAQRLSGGDAGGVLAGLAGWIPSDMLEAQRGAYGDMYAQLPKEASFQAQLQMKKEMADAAQTDSDFSEKIMEMLTGIPAFRQELKDQKVKNDLAIRNQKLKEIAQQEETAYKNWYRARMDNNDKEANYWKAVSVGLEQQRIAISQGNLDQRVASDARQAAKDRGLTPDGQLLPGYQWKDPKNHGKGTKKLPTAASSGGWGKIQADMADDIDAYVTPGDYPGQPDVLWPYAKAFKALMAKYSGMVQDQAKLRALITKLLKQKGFKPKAAKPGGGK